MHEANFHWKSPLSSLEIAVIWTVLLKDYTGSSTISFFLTDSSHRNSSRITTRAISLVLDEGDTLEELCRQIEEQLARDVCTPDSSKSTSFQTHICISHGEPGFSPVSDKLMEPDAVDTNSWCLQDVRIDVKVKVLISEQGESTGITFLSNRSASSSSSNRQIIRISQQFEQLLHHVHLSKMGDKLLYSIPTTSEADLRQIWKWNRDIPKSGNASALEIFSRHVKHDPSALAVNAWDGDLTYRNLDDLSTLLSSRLAQAGISKGNIVPLCFEKSRWTLVAVWAVIKTGAAFVLLDETLPQERLQQLSSIIANESILVLTSAGQQHRAKLLASVCIVVDSDLLEAQALLPSVTIQVERSDLIYIVFTSGTTGVPKAAMIRHSNICSFAASVGSISAVSRSSRILALASYAYDVSLGNMFLSLLTGACICIPSSWECKNNVARVVDDYQITHAQMTPSVSKMLCPSQAQSLEVLDLCGEPCSEDALVKWRASNTRVMNTYSPAECTVTSVANTDVLRSPKPSIIGNGLGCCWVLDPIDRDRLSPIGAVGELVLEGPLVGFGYLHDSESTRAAFFEDPEWLLSGLTGVSPGRKGRLYRTGDLVRYTDDGKIDYIGRRDLQVKIRGQRVELGELSAHLHRLIPESMQWCPEVVTQKSGAEILVVFLVLPAELKIVDEILHTTVDLVDRETRRRLPPVMVPGAYARIENIPLSLTGKTDHRKLKEIALSMTPEEFLLPQTNNASYSTISELSEKSPHTEDKEGNAIASATDSLPTDSTGYSSQTNTTGDSSPTDINGDTLLDVSEKTPGSTSGVLSEGSYDVKINVLKLLWSEIFDVDISTIQASDTFFGRGGESLAAIKLVGAAAGKGLQIDVATIFKHSQLSELAARCRLSAVSNVDAPGRYGLLENTQALTEIAVCCGVSVDEIEDAYPCTPMQEGLLAATNQQVATYTGRAVLKLPKYIDAERLSRAWKRVAATHAILRTRIVDSISHGLFQVALKPNELFVGKESNSLEDYLKEDDRKRMGFGTELCRWGIVRESTSAYFVVTMHHAIYDGWTLPRLGAEVFRAYQGVRIQPAIGFNVFIKHLETLPQDPAREFWTRQLAEPEKTTFFPAESASISTPRADSAITKTFPLPKNDHRGISMPSVLRAAWALLVAKLSGSHDVTFGAIVSGRNVPINGIEDLLSPTISTVPVRVRLDGAETVEDFISRIQSEALDAIPFECMGLQNIKKLNSETRKASKFQTLFIVHPPDAATMPISSDASPAEQDLKEMLETLNISSSISDFNEYALMVLVAQKEGKLVIEASFDSRVLETIKVDLLLSQFTHMVKQAGCRENATYSIDSLVYASDRDVEIIWEWNAATFEGVQECIHHVIAQTTARQPTAPAIHAWDGSESFSDVDMLSARLAAVLRRKGVHRGSLIPICMEKSKWAAIAMLGILRAGAGFVAMDVRQQPLKRLRYMIEEVGADWVVTAGPAAALARKLSTGVIACEDLWNDREADSLGSSPHELVSPSDTAFVVFTSGSTGVPKGIIITHANFCSTIQHHKRQLLISKDSRIYDYASYSFDIAVHNALMALALGGCLCVPSEDDRENDIERSFETLKANWTDITPSVARLIDPTMVPGLRTLVLSGEAVGKDLIDQWATRVELINGYGPAECQICTIQDKLQDADDAAKIGRGVGCSTWIVDPESCTLAPIGAVGELLIEGPIVSPGYLNVPNSAFLEDPNWLLAGSRTVPGRKGTVYRTGDLAYYQPDGTIVYVGRATTQTKIHGQRVELSEIEHHVRRCAPMLCDVVADIISLDGMSRVTVFFHHKSENVSKSRGLEHGASFSIELATPPAGLEDGLKSVLPSYMIPSVFFNISHVPLTPTRKVDRKTLKSSTSTFSRDAILSFYHQEQVVDEHELDQKQRTMVYIWSQVLKLEGSQVKISSDFFQLGGDSISAMRLVKFARKQGLSFTVADVSRNSRLGKLCCVATECIKEENHPRPKLEMVLPFSLVPAEDRAALSTSAATACNITSDDILDVYPCTAFQEGVFAQTAADPSAYVQHTILKFSSTLSLARVLAAWESAIASSPILRTRVFQSERGSLMQAVIREFPQWRRYASAEDYLTDAERTPMWLGNPLSRLVLVRQNDEAFGEHMIIWSIHHALYDAWTIRLILREVSSYYQGQENVDLSPAFNVYVEFLHARKKENEDWWRSNLVGASDAAVFPKALMTSQTASSTCTKRQDIALPQALPAGYTVAALLRSAWAVLMGRYTGGECVLFGEIRHGRNVPIDGIDRMRGPTIASVPVLVSLGRGQSISSLLESIRETSIQMQDCDHLGLQNIARISDDAKAACNFQTLLVFQENEDGVTGDDSIFTFDDAIDDIRNFNSWNLMILFHQNSKGLVAEAVFRESAISADQVEWLLQQTQSILHDICALPPSTTLRQLDTTSEEDLDKIWDWNAAAPEPVYEFLHDLVTKQARRTPDKVAILAQDGQMTYKELDTFSSNVASQLRSRGIGIGCFVPLCFEKSLWVTLAMLAVIKTGAAFSVMDVSYPEDRLKVISRLLKAQLILASSAQLDLARRLCDEVFVINHLSCTRTVGKISLDEKIPRDTNRIMYVCFTSGSTDIPKGVMVTHRNLASAGIAQTHDPEFTSEDRIYDFSSHAFDVNIWHTWCALIIGACLCIPSHEERMGDLAGSINSFQSTALFLTPSVARTLDPAGLSTVQRLYLGGEAVTPLDVSMWREHLDLWGAYGPTEATPLCVFTRLKVPESASNIGRGRGVNPWICNPHNHNELVAIGAIGEMLLEGPLVTLGYYDQPEKTAAVFIEDPDFLLHGSKARRGRRGRLYKTGDLVRYSHDGTIEYLGRADSQVKLRGQRVEFGEIEYHLKDALPEIAATVCEIITHATGRPMLVAFCALSSATNSLDQVEARKYLSKRLPPYMIPEAFLAIPEIPRNPSGKINRQKLQAMGPELLQKSTPREVGRDSGQPNRPLTEKEALLQRLWIAALGLEAMELDPDSDFIEAGADSIAAMKLSSLARKHDLSLTVPNILKNPRLESMATIVEPIDSPSDNPSPFSLIDTAQLGQIQEKAAEICGITVGSISDIYPCTPLQTELFALTMRQPQAYIKRSVFELPAQLSFDKLIQAWNTIIDVNAVLRTRFVEIEDHGLLQVVAKGHVEMAKGLGAYLAHPPEFDLGSPLSLVVAFPDERPPKIVWTVHHALYDGWSVQIMEEQLRKAYHDQQISMPPAFSRFVQHVSSKDPRAAAEFWQQRLAGCASTATYPPLPFDTYQVHPSKTFTSTLHPNVASGVNIQSTIHAAWALIVAKLSECDDVVFAATLAGRDASIPGIEQIVGPTITPVPIRVRLSREQLLRELLGSVERDTTGMSPYQHIGMKSIERINADTRAASKLQTLIVVTPTDSSTGEADAISTSTYEVKGDYQDAFHTFGLLLFFTPSRDGLGLEIIFDPCVLDQREVERLSGRLESVISTLGQCHGNETRVSDVECLGKEDLEDIWSWGSALPLASEHLLHDVILDGARQWTNKIAIDAWDCQIEYTQVGHFSRILEWHLRSHAVGRGSIVPILAPKSGYVPVAALSVLRTGATFLPLDATQPLNRLKAIVEEVGAAVILASQTCTDVAASLAPHTLSIEQCLKSGSEYQEIPNNIYEASQPEDVACILFTSGSTGVPKGVLQTHRAIASAVTHQAAESGFSEETRAFEFASYGFDVSWNMIFKTLAVGGTLCVPSEDERQNDLVGALNRTAATLTELTASVARLIDPSQLSTLETLIMSGEFVDLRDFEHWKPKVRLVVCYGPSECTSVATMNPGLRDGSSDDGIGKAISCVTWLVDPQSHRRLMPVGAVGEILIEGPIVGNGYYKNGSLTSNSYVSDLPWLEAGCAAIHGRSCIAFKSGDLARYDSNGNLHFISRKDTQVKLRGQRVELEEVQHHVHATIGNCVGSVVCCAVGELNSAREQLAAFLSREEATTTDPCALTVPTPAAETTLETLDTKLKVRLPKYMIPAVYYFVTAIPRTANGKIDRRKLVQIAVGARADQVYRGRADRHAVRRAPATSAEIVMQQLWSTALGVSIDSIGADDNFFNLNGDSISAMKLVANARSRGHSLHVSDVFTDPTLSKLALKINSKEVKEQPSRTDRPFELLEGSVDETSIRLEVAEKCGMPDPSAVEDVYPCTPLQKNMLAATIKEPSAFISMRLYRIPPEVDLRRLQAAWATVVARNRILRTRLVDLKAHGLHQAAVHGHSLWDTYSSTQAFLECERKEEMGVGSRLTRWALIEEQQERRLVWTVHHAVYDGWSLQMIEAEVAKAYLGQNLPAPQPDMRPMVRYLLQQGQEASLEYWDQELEGANQSANFPALTHQSYEPKPETYLEKTISADLTSLPTEVNLAALVYGSWSLVISRITGNNKIRFGTILTGRNAPVDDIDKLMGPTITTVPILIDIDSSSTIQDYMTGLRDKTVRMILHEHLGVSEIRKISESSAAACNFQTVLVIQPPALTDTDNERPSDPIVMEEMDETAVDGFPNQHAVLNQYGLMIEILPKGGRTAIRASFDGKLISALQMERIIDQWEHIINWLVQTISNEPLMPLESLDTLCPRDLDDIWAWNKNFPETEHRFVHQTISEIAKQQPGAPAIDAWDGQLTYSELETFSSRLTEQLIEAGVGPGCFVPLIFPKSMWANVAMLAVLKAGGTFVPLDADHPEGRLRAVMQPLQADIILCSASTRDRAARLARQALMVDSALKLDGTRTRVSEAPFLSASDHREELPNADLAYAVFTSGSTGAPKGVKISHRNFATAIRHQTGAQGFQIDSSTRTLDSSSYSFDACVFNLFYTLTQGGCLCVPSDDSLKGDLGSFMRKYRINWAQLVPSVARTLDPETLMDLKSLILTGEALTRGDIETWGKQVRLLNVYGPTECTILCAISSPITSIAQAGNIGQGYGANLWLTEIGNPHKLAPIGSIGEILIEGPIVGAGYLGPYESPLVVDPPWLATGTGHTRGRHGTLYRTGDQARYTDDGTVVLIGRIGSDIKLRGQRVDLMEVEDIARRHNPLGLEMVADIVHVNWGEKDQDRQILLLFTAHRDVSTQTVEELEDKIRRWVPDLKSALDAALPSYIQPEAIVPLSSIPRTSSAKIDRRRLKDMGKQLRLQQLIWITSNKIKTSATPLSTPEEQIMASLWAEILGVDPTSIVQEDDFFMLGGTSLGVMRLTTAAHERGILLKAQDVFQHPRLAPLAQKIKELSSIANEVAPYKQYSLAANISDPEAFVKEVVAPALHVSADEVEDILPANGFQVDYMHNEEEPLGLQYAYLDIGPEISWDRLIDTCRAVVQSFQCLRARFIYHEGTYYQIILRNAPMSVEELVANEQMTTFSNSFCARDCRAAAVGDIFTKLSLVDTGTSKRRVILRMSHMQNDGWCTIRILHTIARVYNGGDVGRTPDWTRLLCYRKQVADASRKYWRSVLQDTTQTTPPLVLKPGGTKVRTLRTFALANFHASGDNRRTRPTVVINVAWALLLQQLIGHNDIVFGNVTTGRNGDMPGLDSAVGPCVNMLPMRLRLSGNEQPGTRKQQLRALVEASAQQVDERTAFEGLDWDDTVDNCTQWPTGTRYASAVHFRNMAFEPELALGPDRLVVGWYELVATPHWTTVLVYPEDDVLRLWLLANPAEIGDQGADEILNTLAAYVDEILAATREDTV